MPRWVLLPFALVPPAIVLLIYAVATVGTTDSLGRVPVPGERTLELDAGKVTLHYEEGRNLEEGSGTPGIDDADFLEIPRDLEVGVRRVDGPRLQLERTSTGNVAETDGRVAKAFARIEVPESGRYVVGVRPIDRRAPKPFVTFGPNGWEQFRPWGIGVAIALVAGLLLGVAVLVRFRD